MSLVSNFCNRFRDWFSNMADIMRECQQSNWPSIQVSLHTVQLDKRSTIAVRVVLYETIIVRSTKYDDSHRCYVEINCVSVNFGFVPVTIRTACNFKDISTTSFSHFHVIFIATYNTFDMVLHLTCQLELPDQNNAISCF